MRNESYSLHQIKTRDTLEQPNSSLGPTYDVVANVDNRQHTYDVVGQN